MNRVGVLILAVAGGLMMPVTGSGQTLVDQTYAAADGPALVGDVGQNVTAAEQLRPAASTAALFTPMRTQVVLSEEAEPYQQVEIDADGDNDGVPYMVAGGIAFLAGAIVGDDVGTVLMLGGAGVGAYGAFIYFGGD